MGRTTFTPPEIEGLRRLLREKQTADRSRQKTLRARMRRMGFYISDFSLDSNGFGVSDLDDLISRGRIAIDEGSRSGESTLPRATTRAGGAALDALVSDAVDKLARVHARPIPEVEDKVPHRPGLYSIYGSAAVWGVLGLGQPPNEGPLYLGKAETSLVSRDLDTHFRDGRTGSSTVRRSIAALLHDALGLEGRPRNLAKPERPTNYGLSPEHDAKLTRWMREHLFLAVWAKADHCAIALEVIEHELLQKLQPPLNLVGVVTRWTPQVKAARKVMADEARRYIAN